MAVGGKIVQWGSFEFVTDSGFTQLVDEVLDDAGDWHAINPATGETYDGWTPSGGWTAYYKAQEAAPVAVKPRLTTPRTTIPGASATVPAVVASVGGAQSYLPLLAALALGAWFLLR